MNQQRGPWYLVTGLILGVGLGLLGAWVVFPVKYTDTVPQSLRTEYKEIYRALIAQAYLVDGDLGRARSRLALLKDERGIQVLADQAQRLVARNGSPEESRALAQLAADLQKAQAGAATKPAPSTATPTIQKNQKATPDGPPTVTLEVGQVIFSPTPRPTATSTPVATFTLRAMRASSTPGAPFELKDKQKVCDSGQPNALLQVEVRNAANEPVPGVRVNVTWTSGQDSFYTGLFTQIDPGYADFNMTPGVVYSLQIGEGGNPVSKLEAPECKAADSSTYPGGLKLVFNQP